MINLKKYTSKYKQKTVNYGNIECFKLLYQGREIY